MSDGTDDAPDELIDEPVSWAGPGTSHGDDSGGDAPQPDAGATSDEEPDPDVEASAVPPSGRGTRPAFVAARAVVVLAAAAALYTVVVPATHVQRSRLATLVPTASGLRQFAKVPAHGTVQNAARTGLTDVTAAAKKTPDRTGVYSVSWAASQTSVGGVIAFLLPDAAGTKGAATEFEAHQLGTTSYAANGLHRQHAGAVAGIPGSHVATFVPSAKAPKGTPSLALTEQRYGRVVAVTEAIGTATDVGTEASALATREYALLQRQHGQVDLAVTEYPLGGTIGWAVGAVVLSAAFALLPVSWRRRRERRRRAYEEEMANRIVVKGQVIVKHHL